MYLQILLLVSPAFGMQCNSQLGIGSEIVNQLDSIVGFATGTKALFDNSKLFDIVSESLKEAEKNIQEMDAELKLLETKELQFEDNYFPKYNEAKSYLRKTRSELRNLARRNVKAVRDLKHLLEDVDKNEDRVLFKLSIKKMKDLMIETLKSLEAARETYKSALEAYDNLISSVATQNTILEKVVNSTTAEFEIDRKYTNKVSKACAIASYFTFGLCSIIRK